MNKYPDRVFFKNNFNDNSYRNNRKKLHRNSYDYSDYNIHKERSL